MVCRAGEKIQVCAIQFTTPFEANHKLCTSNKISLFVSTRVKDLYNYIEEHYHIRADNFKLFLFTSCQMTDLSEVKDKTMEEIGVDFSVDPNEAKNTLFVTDPTSSSWSQKNPDYGLPTYNLAAAPPLYSRPLWGEDDNFKNFIKTETSYVGLVNQAMTCYLNSLLQALYMTPEFRNALYNWEYVDGSEKDEALSIPYQLQKLFLNLQTSTKSAVETTSLTKSFGWDSTEAWQQHDIQELCRVMFDALEQKFKNTEQADLINRLYEGKMIDYVKCLECGTEKSREDTFLDIPLPVRPFGSNVAYTCVEEAIRAFVQYEILEGANQYHCEKCNKKCDAHKGLKFTKFPYLLTLHLKRFDFDYKTFHRIKLNDRVTFPDILNLNPFISSTTSQESPGGEEDIGLGIKCDDSSTTDSGTLDDDCIPCDNSLSNSNHSANHDQDDDEGIDMSNGPSTSNCTVHNHENEKNRGTYMLGRGPYQYELFSIMIHSGSASGGHYYAYIKDFRTQEWLCFNDQSVTQITHDDIQKTYGGGPTRAYYSGAYSSSTNAYMLMYRQIDRARNSLPMQVQDFPRHIQELLKKMKESEDNDRKNREKQMSIPRLKVYCHHPVKGKLMDIKLYLMADTTWVEATEQAYKKFGLENIVNLDQCRLVSYDHNIDLIECSYDDREQESVASIWQNQHGFDLLLEIRRKDQKFETFLPGGVATKVFVIDVAREEVIDGPINIRGLLSQSVKEYKQTVGKVINMDPKQMKIILPKYSDSYDLVENDDSDLQTEGIYNVKKVFVLTMNDTDNNKPLQESTVYKIIKNFKYVISLHIQLPDISKEALEELNIPSLVDKYEEKEKPISNGLPKLGVTESHWDVNSKYNEASKGSVARSNEDTTIRNISPQLGEAEEWNTPEQSNSEDSSLSDSDKTLVGDAPEDEDPRPPTSWEPRRFRDAEISKQFEIENWDIGDDSDCYFKATPHMDSTQKLLKVLVDKRMRLSTLKKELEPLVGVSVEYFKVFRLSNDTGESECSCLTEQLNSYNDGERLSIKLGRALRSGEFKVKLYQLLIDSIEPYKFLCEWIVSKNMTVGQAKKEILAEIKRKYDIDIPYERCRLREKYCKTASKVFLDEQKFDDLRSHLQFEMIIQELPDKETVTDSNQIVLFVRRWLPAKLVLEQFQEIVLENRTVEKLKKKLSSISDIPEEYINIAKGKGAFPCDNSVLRIQNEHDWNEHNDSLSINFEDGDVYLYRDSRENPKRLNPDEVMEIAFKENSRLTPLSTTSSYSPRRERALKIYLDTK
ncbi:PREDICTED: ubiquitin carboxyl-terminal hydrolase 47 isoform X4 [Dinoponera quadriceps]|nr:PREDICTED: ubiquitin carboxyl-terminal hydrolase 47 isoform X4 [Dinoponera quadriceps]XP_014476406.1 PREDICTED: ubiquitin carboxyl-terminal hydrolase 47 isoform X4 [Dinoponera quadriceps]XP_014476407.1 PREDICTED: ubiquitin carboxyl-terminal hydrolase 47 isoform X4 [Dinoponera quadriceps]XP_014476408.1 PREDICTED: ubiquitin carboxyl-terminal hydrolase 47 isoform X4 [Dinoponera quadriceps]XP_014476409.1 PREDICTED: ubiquitin carboxyl-terminal hydrolase 47 isoform X4 [Dinoponera quadriceps]